MWHGDVPEGLPPACELPALVELRIRSLGTDANVAHLVACRLPALASLGFGCYKEGLLAGLPAAPWVPALRELRVWAPMKAANPAALARASALISFELVPLDHTLRVGNAIMGKLLASLGCAP